MKAKTGQLGNFKLRSVGPQKLGLVRIDSKQMMRDIITDYIIQNLTANNTARRVKQRKYEPIVVKLELNGREETFSFDFLMILEKYISMEKQNLERQGNIEPLILDILDFVDKLEEKISLSVEMDTTNSTDSVLGVLVTKHFRDRQRQTLQGQFEDIRKKIYTKYKKVSFIELGTNGASKKDCEFFVEKGASEENSQRVSRSTITALEKEEYTKKHFPVPTKSKLKTLVDTCNVFDYPQRVQALKREKLINEFCQNQAEFIEVRQSVKKHYPCQPNTNLTPETAKLLQDWINDISLSEHLFRKKYCPKKQSQSKRKSASSSEEQGSLNSANVL